VVDLLNTLRAITDKGAGFKVLDQPALETTNAYGQLLLNILAAIGQFEVELIKTRMAEGRKHALARGVRFGPKPKMNSYQIAEALRRREEGETYAAIARSYGVTHPVIMKLVERHRLGACNR